MKNLIVLIFTLSIAILALSSFVRISDKINEPKTVLMMGISCDSEVQCDDYLCPEDELWCLWWTGESRVNSYGVLQDKWKCEGDSDHIFWIKSTY